MKGGSGGGVFCKFSCLSLRFDSYPGSVPGWLMVQYEANILFARRTMTERILRNDMQWEGVKTSQDLASELFGYTTFVWHCFLSWTRLGFSVLAA